jgi:hypothetical protein
VIAMASVSSHASDAEPAYDFRVELAPSNALRHITEKWQRPPIPWHAAKAQLAIQFAERFVLSE